MPKVYRLERNFLATSAHALKWGLVLDKESINTHYQTKAWQWGQLHMKMSFLHPCMNEDELFIFISRIHISSYIFIEIKWVIGWLIAWMWQIPHRLLCEGYTNGYKIPKILDSGQRFAFPQEYFFCLLNMVWQTQ